MTPSRILVGLIGANIQKSLSPALHEDAFSAAQIDGHYHLMDLDHLPSQRLEHVFGAVKAAGFSGVNITFPVKQAILPLLDEVSADARQIGAVNTVTIARSGAAKGYNTDRSGFRRNLEECLGDIGGQSVVLVGAGGAGRAVAFALMDLGVATVFVHDTDTQRATALVADLMAHYGTNRCQLSLQLATSMSAVAGIVNATPIGMLGFPGNPVPMAALRPHHWVADIIYTPMETQLIAAARSKGCRVVTGGGMCVHQAADAFRLFTGIDPDVSRMKSAFARALASRDTALARSA